MSKRRAKRTDGENPGRTASGAFAPGTSGNPDGARARSPGVDTKLSITDPRFDVGELAGSPRDLKPPAKLLDGKVRGASRMDDWRNAITGQGMAGRDKRLGAFFSTIVLSFDQLKDIWLGDDLAARAVEAVPKEAKRPGWDLTISDTSDDTNVDTAELAAEVKDRLDLLGADEALEIAGNYERAYGGGAILIGANDKQTDLTQPLNLDKIASLDWLTPLEARECMPRYAYGDPRAPKYGMPEIYQLTSRSVLPSRSNTYASTTMDVHESRLIIFPGIRVSRYQTTNGRAGWGEAVLTRIWRVLRDFNTAYSSAGVLVSDFAQTVIKMDGLWSALKDDDGKAFEDRLAAMDLGRSTINAITIDAADDFIRTQTPVTGLPDLLEKFAVRLAASCGMPLTLLFGTSPAGMNATGESDIRFFYDSVDAYRQSRLSPALKRLIQIVFRTVGNKVEPKKWSHRFRPLWQESAKDIASAMLTQAQADTAWITAGVISPEEVAKAHWGKGEYDPHLSIDFTSREAGEQAAAGPVTAEDHDALQGDVDPGIEPDPNTPNPPHPDGAAPDPDMLPKPHTNEDRTDDWEESAHPRASDGKFGDGAGSAHPEVVKAAKQHAKDIKAAQKAPTAANLSNVKLSGDKLKRLEDLHGKAPPNAPAAKSPVTKAPVVTTAPAVKAPIPPVAEQAPASEIAQPLSAQEYEKGADDFGRRADHISELKYYTTLTDRYINKELRVNKGNIELASASLDKNESLPPNTSRHIAAVDREIAKTALSRDMLVHRVVADVPGGLFHSLKPGQTLMDHGYVSTSASRAIFGQYAALSKNAPAGAKQVNLHITLKKGSSGAMLGRLSKYESEREVLLGRDQSFKVTHTSMDDGVHTIHMERQ